MKSAVLQCFYRDLIGDSSASHDLNEAEIDKRVQEVIQMEPENPTTIIDLREVKHYQAKTKWAEAEKYLSEDVETAVNDRRHAQISHLAKAIAVRDIWKKVQSRCLKGHLYQVKNEYACSFGPKHQKQMIILDG